MVNLLAVDVFYLRQEDLLQFTDQGISSKMNKWWWKADFNESCNCDHGCPCNWSAIPTHATCDGVGSWYIREGASGEKRLDGLALSILVRFPGPIHRGNGSCIVYIDERADETQREALTQIGTGQAGPGGPFELFSTLYREPPRVLFGPSLSLSARTNAGRVPDWMLRRARAPSRFTTSMRRTWPSLPVRNGYCLSSITTRNNTTMTTF
jgi:hypothetical protein